MKKINEIWQFSIVKYLTLCIPIIIPLYFNNSYWSPFSPAKYLLMSLLILSLVLFYSWGKIREKKDDDLKISFSVIDIGLIVFGIILIVSGIFGFDSHNSFIGNIGQSLNIILIAQMIVFAFFVRFCIKKNESFIDQILIVSFITSIIIAGIAYTGKSLIQYSTGGSTIGNTSYLGAYLIFNFLFGIYNFFTFKKIKYKVFIILGLIIIALNPVFFNIDILKGNLPISKIIESPLVLIGSANGAVIGLVISLVTGTLLAFNFFKDKSLKRLGNILFIFFITGLLGLGFVFSNSQSKIHNLYVQEKSPNRFVFWEIARTGFIERPLLGWGPNNYEYVFQKNFDARLLDRDHFPELWVNQPHNIIWEYLVNTGILGLISYLSLFGLVIISSLRLVYAEQKNIKLLGITIISILVGYFVQNLFVFDTITTYLMYFMLIGIASSLSKDYRISFNKLNVTTKKIFFGLCAILCFLGMYCFVLLPVKELKQLGSLTSEKNIAKISKIHTGLQDISYIGGIGDTAFIFDKFSEKIINLVEKVPEKDAPFLKKEIDSLIETLEQEIKRQPNHFRSYIVLGKLLNYQAILLKNSDEKEIYLDRSISILKQGLEINQVNVSSYLLLAQAYSLKNDLENVITYSRAAIAIAPQYGPVYNFADQVLSVTNNKEYRQYVEFMKSQHMK